LKNIWIPYPRWHKSNKMAKIRVELDTEEDKEIIELVMRLLELLEKSTHSREG
tara:strand:- start:14 stop:172 length:159 start_codon:yes stop_codon:yes gene_type:complete